MSTEAGTYRWMAPEVFDVVGERNKKRYHHKVDVYNFSMVLWELLTNKTPFKGSFDRDKFCLDRRLLEEIKTIQYSSKTFVYKKYLYLEKKKN